MPRNARRTPQTPFEGARPDEYEVEAIEAKRRKAGETEYFVRWKDHAPSENTWEPIAHLVGSEELVNDFEKAWQRTYDAAEAEAVQDRAQRRRVQRRRVNPSSDQAPVRSRSDSQLDAGGSQLGPGPISTDSMHSSPGRTHSTMRMLMLSDAV